MYLYGKPLPALFLNDIALCAYFPRPCPACIGFSRPCLPPSEGKGGPVYRTVFVFYIGSRGIRGRCFFASASPQGEGKNMGASRRRRMTHRGALCRHDSGAFPSFPIYNKERRQRRFAFSVYTENAPGGAKLCLTGQSPVSTAISCRSSASILRLTIRPFRWRAAP